MAVFVRGRPSSCFRLSGPETDFRNGRMLAGRVSAAETGAVRRRCVRIAGRGRVLRTGTKGGLYAGGTFPGVGSVRAVVTGGGGRPMGKGRKSRKKDGRLPVGRKGPSRGSPSREACRVKPEIGPGKTKSGKDLRFGVRPFAADDFRPEDRISAFFRRYSVVSRGNPDTARPFAGARFVVAAWRRRRTPAAGSGEHVFGA